MNFSLFKSRKGVSLPQVMTWRAGPSGELTWHAGPARGCDAALRPRGRATTGPCEAQVVGGHADAPEGRHVASKVGSWRAHGIVGPG